MCFVNVVRKIHEMSAMAVRCPDLVHSVHLGIFYVCVRCVLYLHVLSVSSPVSNFLRAFYD